MCSSLSLAHCRIALSGFLFIIVIASIEMYSDMGKNSSPQNLFSNGRSQFATKNNTRIIAQKGGLAILPCVVKLNSPATVSWIRRKDFQLLTVGLSTHSSDKRFLVEHTRHMGHWSLRIKSVRDEDRGLYECQLSIYPTQSIFIELKVVEAVAEITGAPDIHIDEGSTLQLDCKLRRATESPAFVFWYHDSKMVNYDAQDGFFVQSVLLKDATLPATDVHNHNSLKADDLHGHSLTRTFNNKTIYPQHQQQQQQQQQSQQHPQQQQQQQPVLGQLKLAQKAVATTYLSLSTISTLTIQKVHFHHAGNYTCAPSNARSASVSVHVLQDEKPAAMQHFNRTIFEDDSGNNNSVNTSGASGMTAERKWRSTTPQLLRNYYWCWSCFQVFLMHLLELSMRREFITAETTTIRRISYISLAVLLLILQSANGQSNR